MTAPRHALVSAARRLLPQPGVGVVTATLAILALLAAWRRAGGYPPGASLPACGLALGLAGAVVVTYQSPIHVRHQTKVSLCTVAYYLLAVLTPPPLAALAAGLGALAGELSRRPTSGVYLSDIATESGRRVLLALAGAVVAHMGSDALPAPGALIGAALVLALLDAVSLPLVVAPMCGEPPLRVLVAAARAGVPAEGVQYAVGLLGALAALHYPWAVLLLVVPGALVYMAFKVMKEMHEGTRQLLENMADAVDLRDQYTGGHSRRVTDYSVVILKELGLNGPEVDLIRAAARVHDIGKIGIPDAILHKPERLTDEERAVMEEHPVHGETLLKRYADFARGVEIVRHHHESWDGTGYPDRLKGADIPFGARVVAVADSFDAMTSDRPYRRGMPMHKAATILREGRGRQWDAALVDAFLRGIAPQLEQPAPMPVRLSPPPPHPSLKQASRDRQRRLLFATARPELFNLRAAGHDLFHNLLVFVIDRQTRRLERLAGLLVVVDIHRVEQNRAVFEGEEVDSLVARPFALKSLQHLVFTPRELIHPPTQALDLVLAHPKKS